MADKIGEDSPFSFNFASGGTYDAKKEVTPNFQVTDAVDLTFEDYDQTVIQNYLHSNESIGGVLRVSFDLSTDPYAPYRSARFGILTSTDGSSRAFVGVYETDTGGTVALINIALDGQSIGALARAISQYTIARAEVLNNRYDISADCLKNSPLQNGTNVWALFFLSENCGNSPSTITSTLKNDILMFYTSVEPDLSQNNPSQSLGGYVSPTGVYESTKLLEPLSFYGLYAVLESGLSDYDILQIGDELITVKKWNQTTATLSARQAFSTPIRFHPSGSVVRGISKNDVFNNVLSEDGRQYRCIAVRNTSETEIAQNMKVFFKVSSRNTLSQTRFAIEVPRSDYFEGSATGGSYSTVAYSTIAGQYQNDHFKHAPLKIISGPNAGQTRIISSYNGSTGTFTLLDELPYSVSSSQSFEVDTAPSQSVSSGILPPSVVSNFPSLSPSASLALPYLITDFLSATFETSGVSINVGNARLSGSNLRPNEVIYIWIERHIDDNNDFFINSRSIITFSFNRA